MVTATQPPAADMALEDQVVRKAFRHLVPFLFILYIVSYLDRINIGFAALSMNKKLGLTATMFGLANTDFYAGYAVCEVPSNMLLTRCGARKWIAFISSVGIVASAVSPLLIGFLKDLTHSWVASLLFVAGMMVLGALLIFLVGVEESPALRLVPVAETAK